MGIFKVGINTISLATLALVFVVIPLTVFCQEDQDDPRLPDKCHGIALSDSPDLGPYQAGAIAGLIENLDSSEIAYTTVTGVALGAINAYLLSQYDIGDEDNASRRLYKFWKDLANQELYQQWSSGFLYGMYFQNSLYDSTKMNQYIEQYFKSTSIKRHLNIGIANVLNGSFVNFDEHTSHNDIIKVLQASVSFPGVFSPVEAFGSMWFTGSSIYETDVISPIVHCENLGYEEHDIIIDVILGGNPHLKRVNAYYYNAPKIMQRTLEIMNYYDTMFGILRAQQGHPGVTFRYVIGPSVSVQSRTVPIDYSVEQTDYLFDLGKSDAKKAIEKGAMEQIEEYEYAPHEHKKKKEQLGKMYYSNL